MSNMPNAPEIQEFWSSVLDILEKREGNYKKSLEDYLLSLWVVVEKYKDRQPSYPLFTIIISEAFDTQPCKFDKKWLAYEKDIFWDYENESYIIKEYKNGKWIVARKDVNSYEILKRTLLYQIVDFRKLPPEKLKDPQRFFGIDSGKGDTWYNFTPIDYWACAIRGMEDHLKSPVSLYASKFTKCTWAAFAGLLSLGQSYE
jgi:hypothetical protein